MAITGPAPKDPSVRARRNKETIEWTDVPDEPYTGPSLDLPDGYEWNPGARAWWESTRQVPHAVLWSASDWMFALETAFVVNEMWAGNVERAAEVRQRSAKLALTREDRLKQRLRYVPTEEMEPQKPARAKRASRKRLAADDPRAILRAV